MGSIYDWKPRRDGGRVAERAWEEHPKPVEPVPVASTTWKPWAQMTAEERRKALEKRDNTK